MKQSIERLEPQGFKDYIALALTTFGVGYIPLAPGTWGSAVGVLIYLAFSYVAGSAIVTSLMASGTDVHFVDWLPITTILTTLGTRHPELVAWVHVSVAVLLPAFCLVGIWASGRSAPLFGNSDPSQAVVDEVMGQLITFLFIPFTISWKLILAGFLLFRLFDIWKPYPIDDLQGLPAGIGICADDIVAGVYAGVCLAIIYAVGLSI